MPERTSYLVTVSGTAASGSYVNNKCYFKNLNTGDSVVTNFVGNKAVIDCRNFTNGFSNGDLIKVTFSGREYGGSVHTIDTSKGGIVLTITGVADTAAGISI